MDTLIQSVLQVAVFGLQGLIVLLVLVGIILTIAAVATKASAKPELEVEILNKKFKTYSQSLKSKILNKKEQKADKKLLKSEAEAEEKESRKRIFVLEFDGDVKASKVDQLREEVSAILTMASSEDEVVAKITSPGGVVNGYGLGAAQLIRLRDHGLNLTVCVDEVAASGGYMMSVPATKIICAPFAIVGSIGVVASVPNFNKLLKKYDVDYKEYTAGDFKRTVSIFGEITEKGEQKFVTQLEETHVLFKNFVSKYRPQLDLQKVATGEYWFGEQALSLKLVDELGTSDSYLLAKAKTHLLIQVKFSKKQNIGEKLSWLMTSIIKNAVTGSIEELESRRF